MCFQIRGYTDLKDSRALHISDCKIKLIFQSIPSFQTALCDPSEFGSEKGTGTISPTQALDEGMAGPMLPSCGHSPRVNLFGKLVISALSFAPRNVIKFI